jgi:pyruvate dehydrogenase E2 component (dihydrolipoamide acetyltransferase)
MPKLGNSVETSLIASWKKKPGDTIAAGETLCEVETDKATMEVESPVAGTVLALFFKVGDDVPVMTNIAAIGQPGETFDDLWPEGAAQPAAQASLTGSANSAAVPAHAGNGHEGAPTAAPAAAASMLPAEAPGISPRARNLAKSKSLDVTGVQGTGPGGRIIERDIQAALASAPKLTPLAKSMLSKGEYVAPPQGSGPGGRIMSKDLIAPAPAAPATAPAAAPVPLPTPAVGDEVTVIPVKGVRRTIAARMLNSVQTTAQLTLNASADARALLAYRKRLKASPAALGLQDVTINDLLMYVVSRTLLQFPDLNALYSGDEIAQYKAVHLGFAVDTPRGLIVPVIRNASALSLKEIAQQGKRLAAACQTGNISPDDLNGGTFTVTNLGALGIENFTPVLNVPQVGILGVGNVNLKPVDVEGEVEFIPHLGLSLTINHQVVDGAPGARFLQALAKNLAELELILAL